MSENLKLGEIITTPQQRDAIHIAVMPCKAGEKLVHGDKVWIENGLARLGGINSIGVVDPFLSEPVAQGQTFWLYLNPGSITSLRHDWTHPAFPVEAAHSPDKAASETWLREFCAKADCPGYEAVMQAIQGYFAGGEAGYYSSGGYVDGEYLHFNGSDAHGEIPPEFWTHAEIVLGKPVANKPAYFSCSC